MTTPSEENIFDKRRLIDAEEHWPPSPLSRRQIVVGLTLLAMTAGAALAAGAAVAVALCRALG